MVDISLKKEGRVAELVLEQDVLNTITAGLLEDLGQAVEEISEDDEIGALVLTSGSEKFFSAGWDLPSLLELDREKFAEFYRAFSQVVRDLVMLPVGTIAAIEGPAVAGGCILAMACDWRVMGKGARWLGLNEVDIGLPMPLAGALLAREIAGGPGARDMLLMGQLLTPEEAHARGCVDRLVEAGSARDAAMEIAGRLAEKPEGAIGAMKLGLRGTFAGELATTAEEDEATFLEAWFRPEVRPLLQAAAQKLIPR